MKTVKMFFVLYKNLITSFKIDTEYTFCNILVNFEKFFTPLQKFFTPTFLWKKISDNKCHMVSLFIIGSVHIFYHHMSSSLSNRGKKLSMRRVKNFWPSKSQFLTFFISIRNRDYSKYKPHGYNKKEHVFEVNDVFETNQISSKKSTKTLNQILTLRLFEWNHINNVASRSFHNLTGDSPTTQDSIPHIM